MLASTVNAYAQEINPDATYGFDKLVKVSLSDFALGRYSIAYEHTLNDQSTVSVCLSSIGKYDHMRNYYLGSYYDELGYWHGFRSDLDVAMTGFEISPEIRRYARVNDRMPDGLFASAYVQFRSVSVDVDESFDDTDFMDNWHDTAYPHEIDHTMKLTSLGLGFSIGYQWIADNGLAIEAFAGPLFRAVSRTYEFTDLPLGQLAAEEGVDDRMHEAYYPGYPLRDAYLGRTGPWLRFGLNLGIGLQ